MGKIYHARHQFDEAASQYKLYLQAIKSDHPHRRMVREEIRRCANGLELQFSPGLAIVENLGRNVNSEFDEFAPILSPNFSTRLYYSAIRQGNMGQPRNRKGRPDERLGSYLSDMFSTENANGQWQRGAPMHVLLNSPKHDILLDFNRSGNALIYFKGWDLNSGEIVVDTFRQDEQRTLSSDPFQGPMNPLAGDLSLYLANDTLLFFASRRAGGYGGLDLYKSTFEYGRWSNPENLGPAINTPYDETSPFLARDGQTLYFSSNDSHKSIGGLDIFKAIYVPEKNQWTETINLGIPINSAGDDTHFRLAKDGFTAFFASSRKDGYGQRDLYAAYFNEFLPEQEAPTIYTPPVVQIPEPVEVVPPKVEEPLEEDPFEEVNSIENIASPELLVPGSIIVDHSAQVINAENRQALDKIANVMIDYPQLDLLITAYINPGDEIGNDLFAAAQEAEQVSNYLINRGVKSSSIFNRALVPENGNGQFGMRSGSSTIEFGFSQTSGLDLPGELPLHGQTASSVISDAPTNLELFYKVQIASAKKPYHHSQLSRQSHPMVEKSPDFDYYRYTVGAFASFANAERLRRTMVKAGFSSAYVIPYLYGFRIDKTEARRKKTQFPDLDNFLNRRF